MFTALYYKLSPVLLPFFVVIAILLAVLSMFRGQIIENLRTELLNAKTADVRVTLEQQEVAYTFSMDYEKLASALGKEKVYVDREVDKIILLPSYDNVCFDDAGMYQLTKAIKNPAGIASEPVDAVSSSEGTK